MNSATAWIDFASNAVYPMQGVLALIGVYCLLLVFRRTATKRFRNRKAGDQFLEEIEGLFAARNFEGAAQLCDSPPYWSKAAAQLGLIALQNPQRELGGLKRLVGETFERDILADLDYRMSWVNLAIKGEPMLGLLGTVLGMISAFSKISSVTKQGNPAEQLAADISFALITTAVGLIVAIPLMMLATTVQIRMAKMQDEVQQHLERFLEAYEAARQKGRAR